LRAGGAIPKQYRALAGETVIRPSLALFSRHPEITAVQPVIHPDDASLFADASAGLSLLKPVNGGATRQASVRRGLEALASRAPDIVLIHDAVRPFASPALVSRAIAAARKFGAAVPAIALTDTVKKVDRAGRILATLERSELRAVQTPQAFGFRRLIEAHQRAARERREN
jgi:2-C-methyl-D-erythritol 4-phosphate cytidylyltransferase/2-C-methyl-D-erythritol 2,4-cyclodiphosphate synthase